MKKLRLPGVALVALLAAAVALALSGPAAAAKHHGHAKKPPKLHSVNFSATYAGNVTEKVTGQTVKATTTAPGKSNLLGAGTISGSVTATTVNPPCSPLNGPGVIKGKKGILKVTVLPSSHACAAGQDDQDNISLSGTIKVNKGTAKFKKAKGSVHFSGHYDRKTGAFNVKLIGKIKY